MYVTSQGPLERSERVIVRRYAQPALYRSVLALEESACRPQEMRILEWEHIHPKPASSQEVVRLGDGKHWFQLTEYKAKDRRRDRREPRVRYAVPAMGV